MNLAASFRLDGRIALVCGAARGLGWEIAQALAEAGACVILSGRSEDQLVSRVEELRRHGRDAAAKAFDLGDRAAVDAALSDLPPIDILVNAVGERDRRPVSQISVDDFSRLLDVDLSAAYALARGVLPGMVERRWGRLLMLSSIVDNLAAPNNVSYVAAKGGLSAMTRALAAEYGRHGITCNALAPGFFATETNLAMSQSKSGRAMAARVPTGRWGEAPEIAGAALFLCTPAASYVNGHTMIVDGGVSATYFMPLEHAK